MPTVLQSGPYRFFFVSLDYAEPPHVHVRRDRMVAKFWLSPVRLSRAGGFGRAEIHTIGQLVDEHRDAFLERWDEYFSR
ncbi:MAG: DUF4160 domain-containing protein [Ardenticatenales bacterium]